MFKDKTFGVGFGLLVVLALMTGCSREASTKQSEKQVMLYENATDEGEGQVIKTEKVIRGVYEETGFQNGTMEYLDKVSVPMNADNAIFVKFKVEKGQEVKKGDVIAQYYVDYDRLNLVEFKSTAKSMEENYKATLNSKKADIAELENKIKVMPEGSEKEITKAKLGKLKLDFKQFKKTEAAVKEAKKKYKDFLKETEQTKVLAPASGYIVELGEFEEGELVMNGAQLAAISWKKDFLITIPNESGLSGINLRYNMEVKIGLGSNMNSIDTEMKGRIMAAPNVLAKQDSGSTLYIKPVDPPENANWDGNVFVEFERIRLEDSLLVPYDAVSVEQDAYLESNNKYFVMVMEGGIQRKRYFVSDRFNSDYYLVLGGLEEGQEVVMKK